MSASTQIPVPVSFSETMPIVSFDSRLQFVDNVDEKIRFQWDDTSYTWGMIVDEFTWDSARNRTWQYYKGVE